jgi:hypothetical protein
MLQGVLCLLCSDIAKDVLHMLIHLAHPIGGGHEQRIQERSHSSDVLAGPSEGGKLPLLMVGCHGPTLLERQFMLV